MPRVSVVRASSYGAALGDPSRFRTAAQVYRSSGLVPRLYESAGKRRSHTSISREGSAELRAAIIELGRALRQGDPDFARYAEELAARGKASGIVACALGHRANRVAFALVRDQVPFDPTLEVAMGGAGASWPSTLDHIDVARPTASLPSNGRRSHVGGAGAGINVDDAMEPRSWTPRLA